MAAKQAAREKSRSQSGGSPTLRRPLSVAPSNFNSGGGTYLLTASPVKGTFSLPRDAYAYDDGSPMSPEKLSWKEASSRDSQAPSLSVPIPSMPLRPNRRPNAYGEMNVNVNLATLSEENIRKHNSRMSRHNHLVYNFTSPLG